MSAPTSEEDGSTEGLHLLSGEVSGLASEVATALRRDGAWETFVEVRMGAGPTVRVEGSEDRFAVLVRWGSQEAAMEVSDVRDAVVAADRLARALYEIRRDLRVR